MADNMAGKPWTGPDLWLLDRALAALRREGRYDRARRDYRRHLAACAVTLGRTYAAVRRMASRRRRGR